jgi:hypothetical protein
MLTGRGDFSENFRLHLVKESPSQNTSRPMTHHDDRYGRLYSRVRGKQHVHSSPIF